MPVREGLKVLICKGCELYIRVTGANQSICTYLQTLAHTEEYRYGEEWIGNRIDIPGHLRRQQSKVRLVLLRAGASDAHVFLNPYDTKLYAQV